MNSRYEAQKKGQRYLPKTRLVRAIGVLISALQYCSFDDPYAVDSENNIDIQSANEWKKQRAKEALNHPACKDLK